MAGRGPRPPQGTRCRREGFDRKARSRMSVAMPEKSRIELLLYLRLDVCGHLPLWVFLLFAAGGGRPTAL